MVDFARAIPYYLDHPGWADAALANVEDRLADTPCYAGQASHKVVFPADKAPELLRVKWS